MIWCQLIIILHLIASIESKKLTEEENEKRLEQCGVTTKSKIFNGGKVSDDQAPWAVIVGVAKSDGTGGLCSGTLISPRHILSATHCMANYSDVQWVKTYVGFKFDREDCPENEHIIVPEVKASKVYVQDRKGNDIGRAKFLYFLNFCRTLTKDAFQIQYPDDVMIIELSEDFEYTSEVKPACLANSIEDSKGGAIVRLFGYGDNPPKDKPSTPVNQKPSKPPLLSEELDILKVNVEGTLNRIDPRLFKARSRNKNSIMCPGDSGGGAIRIIGGRNTVVGVAMQTTCVTDYKHRGAEGYEIYGAPGFYSDDICDLTGICTPDSEEDENGVIRLSLFLIPIFMWFIHQ